MNKENSLHVLSGEEQKHTLDALYEQGRIRDWALISLCLKTGMRNKEVCALNNNHLVKFGAVVNLVDVDKQIAYATPRQLPLIDEVSAALRIYLQWKADNGQPMQPNAPFFCTLYTNKRLVPLDFQRIVQNASVVLGVKITPHDLRHTFAAELYRVTGDLAAVKDALGLRSIKAVKIYQKFAPVEKNKQRLQQAILAFSGPEAGRS